MMIRQCFLTLMFLVLHLYCLAQAENDSIYTSTRLVPRIGLNIQKGYGVELGVMLNRFYTRFPRTSQTPMLPYASSGFYISSELRLRNLNELLIGPKIGWELGAVGETSGSYFGAEFIDYTNFDKHSPAVMVKAGLPLMWINIAYGFTMFFNDTFKNEIGKHRLTIVFTINRKANQKYTNMKLRYLEGIK